MLSRAKKLKHWVLSTLFVFVFVFRLKMKIFGRYFIISISTYSDESDCRLQNTDRVYM